MSIKKVTLIGGGVLGAQIAFQSAYKGFDVSMFLRSDASVDRAKPKIERLHKIYLAELTAAKETGSPVSRGLAPDMNNQANLDYDALIAATNAAFENVKYITDLEEALKDTDLVIEALAENPQDKIEFFTKMQQYLPEKAIVVTNSSTLLPSVLAESTGRPEKFLALHFANNIWAQNTAEIMGHSTTDDEAYKQVSQFAADIGMIPLELKKEQAGYILNSLLVPFLSAAEQLLVDGVAEVETIDKTWCLATGAPKGPFQILDVVGITTAYNIVMNHPAATADPTSLPARIGKMLKEEYLDKGKTGLIAGEGFYKYN